MQPRIENFSEKKLIGKKVIMSFAENRTYELWSSFMPQRKAINDTVNNDLISLEVYPPHFFDHFDPQNLFEKWAAVEVNTFQNIPEGMELLIIPDGLYAVFIHYGLSNKAATTYDLIFKEWLPKNNYTIDTRPHFAVMGSRYKNEDPSSEEEIWIPIKKK